MRLNPNYVLGPLNELLDEAHGRTIMGLRLAEQVEVFPEPTAEEGKHMQFALMNNIQNIHATKDGFKQWLFKKTFEDVYHGIRKSMNHLYVLYEVYQEFGVEIEEDDQQTAEHLIIEKLKAAQNKRFPALLDRLETMYGEKFQFQEAIESFNIARNCLVHEDGIVTEKRCNNAENDQLIIKGNRFRLFFKRGEEEFPAEFGQPGPENAGLMLGGIEYEIVFELSQQINLSLNDYFGILETCIFLRAELDERVKKLVNQE